MFPPDILQSVGDLVAALRGKNKTVATAESCTGGLVAAAITSVAGASDVFACGFVTYADVAKTSMIQVDPALIRRYGAVSAEVAKAMAEGALSASGADLAVSITGIAGPGGGSAEKPVGLVFTGTSSRTGKTRVRRFDFGDIGRKAVRLASVREALKLLEEGVE